MYDLEVRPAATQMARDAYEWYEEQQPGLGDLFLREIENSFHKIEKRPLLYATIHKGYRQILLKTFPYVVVFEIMQNTVVVFSVFHTSRSVRKKFKK